ncbi:MAG: ExbD/TolR family protein [Burkholderiales bacterium]|nr:ExbD/TolR family protein [Burkholderiales bacterium]
MSQINVVPFIDVMLVLLVIFMATAPMIQTSQVELPSVGKASAVPAQPIEITVLTDGRLRVRDREREASERGYADVDALMPWLRERLKASPDHPVVIAADQRTPYGKVMAVMDALQREQVARIGLLARQRSN